VVVWPAPVGSLARVVTTQAIILSLAVTSVAASLSQRWWARSPAWSRGC